MFIYFKGKDKSNEKIYNSNNNQNIKKEKIEPQKNNDNESKNSKNSKKDNSQNKYMEINTLNKLLEDYCKEFYEKFELEEIIKSGSAGAVYRGMLRNKQNSKQIAFKFLFDLIFLSLSISSLYNTKVINNLIALAKSLFLIIISLSSKLYIDFFS